MTSPKFVDDLWEQVRSRIIPSLSEDHPRHTDMKAAFYFGLMAYARYVDEIAQSLGDESFTPDTAEKFVGDLQAHVNDVLSKLVARSQEEARAGLRIPT